MSPSSSPDTITVLPSRSAPTTTCCGSICTALGSDDHHIAMPRADHRFARHEQHAVLRARGQRHVDEHAGMQRVVGIVEHDTRAACTRAHVQFRIQIVDRTVERLTRVTLLREPALRCRGQSTPTAIQADSRAPTADRAQRVRTGAHRALRLRPRVSTASLRSRVSVHERRCVVSRVDRVPGVRCRLLRIPARAACRGRHRAASVGPIRAPAGIRAARRPARGCRPLPESVRCFTGSPSARTFSTSSQPAARTATFRRLRSSASMRPLGVDAIREVAAHDRCGAHAEVLRHLIGDVHGRVAAGVVRLRTSAPAACP